MPHTQCGSDDVIHGKLQASPHDIVIPAPFQSVARRMRNIMHRMKMKTACRRHCLVMQQAYHHRGKKVRGSWPGGSASKKKVFLLKQDSAS